MNAAPSSAVAQGGRQQEQSRQIQALLPAKCPPKLERALAAHIRNVLDKSTEYRELADIVREASDLQYRILHRSPYDEASPYLQSIVVFRSDRVSRAAIRFLEELQAEKNKCQAELEKMIGDFD